MVITRICRQEEWQGQSNRKAEDSLSRQRRSMTVWLVQAFVRGGKLQDKIKSGSTFKTLVTPGVFAAEPRGGV